MLSAKSIAWTFLHGGSICVRIAAIDESWLGGVTTVGVTSGASAPERLVGDVCDWFRARGVEDVGAFRSAFEDVVFRLPVELRRAERSAA